MSTRTPRTSLRTALTALVPSCAIAFSCTVALPRAAQAKVTHVAKLAASDGAAKDQFGAAVALDGGRAVVGANFDDDRGVDAGAAYVYERSGKAWRQVAKLTAKDSGAGDSFGSDLAIEGARVLVGARGHSLPAGKFAAGAAYIFESVGGAWQQVAKLSPSDAAEEQGFGQSVALDGDRALVSALIGPGKVKHAGAAYVFERRAGTWTQVAKLTAKDGEGDDFFGWSVALEGDRAIIGALQDDDAASDAGAAYVFDRVGGAWTQTAKLMPGHAHRKDGFGHSVALSGTRALIGAFLCDAMGPDAGSAYVFELGPKGWTEKAQLMAGDGKGKDWFAAEVALEGNRALVGAYLHDAKATDAGAAYVFELETSGRWKQTEKIVAPDAGIDEWFGVRLALDGGQAIVSSLFDRRGKADQGAAYIVDLPGPPTEKLRSLTTQHAPGSELRESEEPSVANALVPREEPTTAAGMQLARASGPNGAPDDEAQGVGCGVAGAQERGSAFLLTMLIVLTLVRRKR